MTTRCPPGWTTPTNNATPCIWANSNPTTLPQTCPPSPPGGFDLSTGAPAALAWTKACQVTDWPGLCPADPDTYCQTATGDPGSYCRDSAGTYICHGVGALPCCAAGAIPAPTPLPPPPLGPPCDGRNHAGPGGCACHGDESQGPIGYPIHCPEGDYCCSDSFGGQSTCCSGPS